MLITRYIELDNYYKNVEDNLVKFSQELQNHEEILSSPRYINDYLKQVKQLEIEINNLKNEKIIIENEKNELGKIYEKNLRNLEKDYLDKLFSKDNQINEIEINRENILKRVYYLQEQNRNNSQEIFELKEKNEILNKNRINFQDQLFEITKKNEEKILEIERSFKIEKHIQKYKEDDPEIIVFYFIYLI